MQKELITDNAERDRKERLAALAQRALGMERAAFEALWSDENAIREGMRHAFVELERCAVQAAIFIGIMDARGIALPATFPKRLRPIFRRLVENAMEPELFPRFLHEPELLEKVSRWPPSEQRKLLASPMVEVVVRGGEQRWTKMMMNIEDLNPTQRKLVITPDGPRTEAEQIAKLEGSDLVKLEERARGGHADIELDRRRGGIIVNGIFIPTRDLAQYLRDLM